MLGAKRSPDLSRGFRHTLHEEIDVRAHNDTQMCPAFATLCRGWLVFHTSRQAGEVWKCVRKEADCSAFGALLPVGGDQR